jgi:hypothetical protein
MIVRSAGRVRVAAAGIVAAVAMVLGAFAAPAAATAAPEENPSDSAPAESSEQQWAPAETAAIRPGVMLITENLACTANFIYTSGERTFIGSAAHCASEGGLSDLDGCTTPSFPVGTNVTIQGFDGVERTGSLAYSSWLTMQEVGETDETVCTFNDFALIEIDPADVAVVNPSVPIFGGPTGIDTDGLPAGEQVFSYGNSPTRAGLDAISPKTGVSAGDIGEGFAHTYYSVPPDVQGDSGNGLLDSDGEAVGVLSRLNLLAPPAAPGSSGATDVAMAMAYAQDEGGLDGLGLVPGTEAFTPTPAAVPLTAVAPPAGPPLLG